MKIKTIQLMNDAVDNHGEKVSLEILKKVESQTNEKIVSSHFEHDFRFPPIARIHKAFIQNIDGINILFGEVEFFEKQDINKENKVLHKELIIHDMQEHGIAYDRSYTLNNLENDINALQALISDEKPLFEHKKSIEPISTLTIFLGIVATSFVEGFFSKAGSDFWDKLKEIITKNAQTIDKKDKIYIFNTILERDDFKVEIIINFTNPTDYDLKNILTKHKDYINSIIDKYEQDSVNVARIVFNSYEDKILLEYSVFKDGTPFEIRDIDTYDQILENILNNQF